MFLFILSGALMLLFSRHTIYTTFLLEQIHYRYSASITSNINHFQQTSIAQYG